jgi:hypothetical protein
MHLEPLFTAEVIAARNQALGAAITDHYRWRGVTQLTCVGVLKGSIVFLADLIRHIDLDVRIEVLGVSSYAGTESTGHVRITHDLRTDISGPISVAANSSTAISTTLMPAGQHTNGTGDAASGGSALLVRKSDLFFIRNLIGSPSYSRSLLCDLNYYIKKNSLKFCREPIDFVIPSQTRLHIHTHTHTHTHRSPHEERHNFSNFIILIQKYNKKMS